MLQKAINPIIIRLTIFTLLLSSTLSSAQQADLSLNKTVDDNIGFVGAPLHYTITVSNAGPDAATGIVIEEQPSSGVSIINVVPSMGSYNSSNQQWAIPLLAVGTSATLDITAHANLLVGLVTNFGIGHMAGLSDGRMAESDAGYDDGVYTNTGIVHLRERSGVFTGSITNPVPAEEARFGSTVEGLPGDRIAIGAFQAMPVDTHSIGAVYLMSLDGSLINTITNPQYRVFSEFGRTAIAARPDGSFAVGACKAEVNGLQFVGVVYVYDHDGNYLFEITTPTPHASDWFGYDIDTFADGKILVGAPLDYLGSNLGIGAVYLFDADGNLLLDLRSPAGPNSGWFGQSVSRVGQDAFLVGDGSEGPSRQNRVGGAYVFDLAGNLLHTLTSPAPEFDGRFGIGVTGYDDGLMVVSQLKVGGNLNFDGQLFFFNRDGVFVGDQQKPATISGTFGYNIDRIFQDMIGIGNINWSSAKFIYQIDNVRGGVTNAVTLQTLDQIDGNSANDTAAVAVTAVRNTAVDSDGDHASDYAELVAGTDLSDDRSFLALEMETFSPDGSRGFAFDTETGRVYRVAYRTNLLSGAWQTLAEDVVGAGSMTNLVDTNAMERALYRLEVERQTP